MESKPGFPGNAFHHVYQIGVVVRDLDKAVHMLTQLFGIGPFRETVFPPPGRGDMDRRYRGQPGDFVYRQAFADLGNVELEVIQPLMGDSIWTDFLEKHGEGIHHIRFNTYDIAQLAEYLADEGIATLMSGSGIRPGTSWANFDTEGAIGFTIEVMQAVPGTNGLTPLHLDAGDDQAPA